MKPTRLPYVILLGATLVAAPAHAQTEPPSWLLEYVSYYFNVGSNPPNIQEPTLLGLHGWFPYDCGQVTGVRVIDQHNIAFTLRPNNPACADTVRQWDAYFDLGYLPLGTHRVNMYRTFVAANGDSVTEEAQFGFEVVDLDAPPPPEPEPPPPPMPGWLFPYLARYSTYPSQPNATEPTTVVLYGSFPYDCGQIVDAVVTDSAHISFTMQPGPACADTVRTWSRQFDLGYLPEGHHVIHVTRRFISPDSNVVAEGEFGFPVWKDPFTPPPPPPPGPPEHPSLYVRCLSGWYTTAPPTPVTPTTLVLWGWFPYLCGEVANAAVVSSGHVRLTLRPGPACADTVTVWSQAFDLGVLPPGPHLVQITLDVQDDPAMIASLREATITLEVQDDPVTGGVPNPFVTETRFTVVNPEPGPVEVGIFDVHGRRVAKLFQGELAAGSREFRWDGRRDDGSRAAIGVYFSRVAFSHRVVTRRLVMLPRR